MRRALRRSLTALFLLLGVVFSFCRFSHPFDRLDTPVCSRSHSSDRTVAITFDDGPHPVITPLLLSTLRRCGVKATFFVVGKKVCEYPELLRRISADGHQIACHTHSHRRLKGMSPDEAAKEVTRWESDVKGIVPTGPGFMRPPGGEYDSNTLAALRKHGCTLALWSINPGDWRMPPADEISNYVLKHIHPGAVVLLHDGGMNTVKALPKIIEGLRLKGYRFRTMEGMGSTRQLHMRPFSASTEAAPPAPAARKISGSSS